MAREQLPQNISDVNEWAGSVNAVGTDQYEVWISQCWIAQESGWNVRRPAQSMRSADLHMT